MQAKDTETSGTTANRSRSGATSTPATNVRSWSSLCVRIMVLLLVAAAMIAASYRAL